FSRDWSSDVCSSDLPRARRGAGPHRQLADRLSGPSAACPAAGRMKRKVNRMKRIAILGSTGSLGTQTLDVIERLPGDFRVVGLAAGQNAELLLQQAERFRPKVVSVSDRAQAEWLAARLPEGVRALYGPEGLLEVAAGCGADLVVGAMVGSAGLKPTLAAIEAGAAIG